MHGTLGRTRRVFLTTDAVGGVWRYSMAIATGLAARGWHCTLATLGPSPGAAQRAEAAGFALLDTGLPLDWTAKTESALASAAHTLDRLAQRAGAETVHLHTPTLAAFPWQIPVVATAHSCVGTWWHAVHNTPPPADFRWRMSLMAEGIRRATMVIAPSRAIATALQDIYLAQRPIDIVHNGLAPATQRTAIRERRVLTAGRLWDAGKNMIVLDKAAAVLGAPIDAAGPAQGPDGTGFAPQALNLLGNLPQPKLRDAMARAAIFAAPSLYEPFGLAVLEAAQLATPLVLADNPTFRELWDGAAIFVDPRNAAAWAETLRALLGDQARRRQLGAAALLRSRDYTATSMVRATVASHTAAALEAAC